MPTADPREDHDFQRALKRNKDAEEAAEAHRRYLQGLSAKATLSPPPRADDPSERFGKNAANVHDAATALTERIRQFEAFLCDLPGRVEALVVADHSDKGGPKLHLRFHGKGKNWALDYALNAAPNDKNQALEYKPLIDAPLRIKIEAVQYLPDILKGVQTGQQELYREIVNASATFDAAFPMLRQGKEGK